MSLWTATLVALVAVTLPRGAWSEEIVETQLDSPAMKARVLGNVGLGSAVGELGVTFAYAPISSLQFEFGLGLGETGPQIMLMPRVKLVGNQRHGLFLGTGPSISGLLRNHDDDMEYALWLNAELGYEYRSRRGVAFLLAAGVTHAFAGNQHFGPCGATCDDGNKPGSLVSGSTFPQMRVAVGRWL